MFPLKTLIITCNICYYLCFLLIKILVLSDREGVINLTKLRYGGDVIYTS